MFSDVIELITYPEEVDDIGDNIKNEPSYRQIYANEKGVRQSEFYQASAVGLKPELTFVIRLNSYKKEESIRYKGKVYSIIRTYRKNKEFLEIVCQGVVNDG